MSGSRSITARLPGAIGNICQQHPRPHKRDKQQCYGKSYPLPPIIELAKLNNEYDETDHQVYPDRNLETTHTVLPLNPLAMITPYAFVKQPTALSITCIRSMRMYRYQIYSAYLGRIARCRIRRGLRFEPLCGQKKPEPIDRLWSGSGHATLLRRPCGILRCVRA